MLFHRINSKSVVDENDIVHIDAQNVYRWYRDNNPKTKKISSVPPISNTWVEWKQENVRIGCLVNVVPIKELQSEIKLNRVLPKKVNPLVNRLCQEDSEKNNGKFTNEHTLNLSMALADSHHFKNAKWAVVFRIYTTRCLTNDMYVTIGSLELNEAGEIIKDSLSVVDFIDDFNNIDILNVVFYTFSFMTCKNISLRNHPRQKQLDKMARKKKISSTRFHVLNIFPTKIGSRRTKGTTHASPSMHIRAGGFKDYTKKGLFGKIFGRFWVDATVVNREAKTIVNKSYEVHANQV